MSKRKVKRCSDWEFLPVEVQKSKKIKTITEKNVLATLCFQYLSHSIYASKNDGWFYCSQKDIENGSNIEHSQVNRVLLKLIMQRLVERKSGTNHRCTHYKLHPSIVELLLKSVEIEEDSELNDTLDEKQVNDTLVENAFDEEANDTLDKIRLDKISLDKHSLDKLRLSEYNDNDFEAQKAPQNHHKVDTKLLYENWCINLNKCKTKDELMKTIEESVEQYQDNIEDFEDTNYFERYKEKCDYRYAILKNK